MVGANPFKLWPRLFAACAQAESAHQKFGTEQPAAACSSSIECSAWCGPERRTSARPFGPNTTKATTPTSSASGAPTPNTDATVTYIEQQGYGSSISH